MRRLAAIALVLLGCKDKYREAARAAAAARDAGHLLQPQPASATLLAHGQNVPRDLQTDGTHLYWLNEGRRAEGKSGLFKMPKDGGDVVELASGRGIFALAFDADSVYFLVPENLSVHKVPKSGGAATTLATEQEGLSAIAVDESHVYWAGAEGVFRVAKSGGRVETVAQNLSVPNGLFVDGQHAYWYSPMAGKLARVVKKGGKPTPLVSEDVTLHTFFIDDAWLYWSFGSEKKAQLKRMSKNGGKPETIVAGQDVPADFAVDGQHVYWNTPDAIFRVPKGGGQAEKVVDGLDRATDLTVDDRYVYWTDRIGRIQRVAKP